MKNAVLTDFFFRAIIDIIVDINAKASLHPYL